MDIDGKHATFFDTTVNLWFAEVGSSLLTAEALGFWGCRSSPVNVTVLIKPVLNLNCPTHVLQKDQYECACEVYASQFKDVIMKVDGTEKAFDVSGDAISYSAGGSLITNRYEEYYASFSNESSAAFININHMFTTPGLLRGFEAYVTKKGWIQFMILKPLCDWSINETYCHAERQCVLEPSSPCAMNGSLNATTITFFARDLNHSVFIMDRQRFAAIGFVHAPALSVSDTPTADYEVIFMHTVEAKYKGNNVFPLPDETVFTVSPGDVIGWVPKFPDYGDIGYYAIDPAHDDLHREYQYDLVYSTFIGAVFGRETGLVLGKTNNYMHMVKGYVDTASTFFETYDAEGSDGDLVEHSCEFVHINKENTYISTPKKKTIKVKILQPIEGLDVAVDKSMVKVYEEATFKFTLTGGAGSARYCINWGEDPEDVDTCNVLVESSEITHFWNETGEYLVKIIALNDLSSEISYVNMTVQATFVSYELIAPIEPIEKDSLQHVYTLCSGKGEALLSYNISRFAPQTMKHLSLLSGKINESIAILDYTLIYFETFFASSWDYLYSIRVFSEIEEKRIDSYGTVEDPVSEFNLISHNIFATNASAKLTVKPDAGTNLTYYWFWNNSGISDQVYQNRCIYHTFTKYGNFTFNITASNKVSSVSKSFDVTVEDRIQEVEFLGEPYFTEFNTSTLITVKVRQGTAMTIHMNYSEALSPAIENFDIADDFAVVRGSYLYPEIGLYNISVYLQNNVSKYSIWTVVPVEFGIKGFQTWLIQEFEGGIYDDIEENEILTVMTSVASRGIYTYNYDLGDGRNYTTENTSITFSYPKWRTDPPYTLVVSVFNMMDRVNITNLTAVHMPIQNLTGFQLIAFPENSTEEMELKLDIQTGNFFNCSWNFSDSSPIRHVNYSEYLNMSGSVFHQFESGDYKVKVNCENRLYVISATTMVSSYTPPSPFVLSTKFQCPGEEKRDGIGKKKEEYVYPIFCDILFITTDQTGRNISYLFDFGYKMDGKDVTTIQYANNTNVGTTVHRFNFETDAKFTIWSKEVTISAINTVGSKSVKVDLRFIGQIANFSMKMDKPNVSLGDTFHIMLKVSKKEYKACYVLDYKVKGASELLYPRYVFGHGDCRYEKEYEYDLFLVRKLTPGKFVEIQKFYFDTPENYLFTITGKNAVSQDKSEFLVKVLDYPCQPPKLSWESAMGNVLEEAVKKAPLFKCRKYSVLAKALPDCLKPNATVKSSWFLQRKKDAQFNPVEDTPVNMSDAEAFRFVIKPRLLQYGTYHIKFNASMYMPDGTLVKETEAVIEGYFLIKQCDLIAKISGGTGKAVARSSSIILNGSESVDPDVNPGDDMDLRFSWYCKQKAEKVKFNLGSKKEEDLIDYPKDGLLVEDKEEKGCFGTGVGMLVGRTHRGSVLKLNGDFMITMRSYHIWLQLTKKNKKAAIVKYELKVLDAEPPLVDIECKLNCEIKVNPTQKFALVAACKNCEVGKKTIYKWEMFRKEREEDDFEEDHTHTLEKYAVTNITKDQNLVVKPGAFSAGYFYQVKLNGYRSMRPPDIKGGGFAMYTIQINEPPQNTTESPCFVFPASGIALKTIFKVQCNPTEIIDGDIPLLYVWEYKPKNSTLWKSITYPSEGGYISNEFKLSAGDPREKFIIQVRVFIKDTYGAQSPPMYTYVQVQEPEEILDTAAVLKMLSEPQYKDPAKLGNLAANLFDSMDKTHVDIEKVNEKIMELTLNVVIDSPKAVSMVLDNMDGASDENAKLSDKAMDESLSVANNVANFAGEMSPEDLASAGSKLLSASGKFTSGVAGDQAADNLANAMANEEKLTSGMAGNMVAGEPASPIVTSNGVNKVSCIDPKSDDTALDGFALPKALGSDVPDGGCTGAANSVGKNRYGFKKLSQDAVHGGTLGLGLSSGLGEEKQVENLTELIRLVIPNKTPVPAPKTYDGFCKLMFNVHLVVADVNESIIIMKIKPNLEASNITDVDEVGLFVFMNKGFAPSLAEHDQNCTLPNPYPDNWQNMDPYDQYMWEEHNKWRCFIDQKALNNTAIGRWCVGVVYFRNDTNRTNILLPLDTPFDELPCKKLNYSFIAYTRACLYWDKKDKTWSGDGCSASRETNDNETVCYCNHLSDFGGGGPLAAANDIDFASAFSGFANLGDNPTVFAVVVCIILVFFIMLFWARRKDKRDAIKAAPCYLEDNHIKDDYWYSVSVQTGYKSGANTTADVFIVLIGSQGESAPRKLKKPNCSAFNRGELDTFLLAFPYGFGIIREIQIWHNNAGVSPGWFLLQAQVTDMQTTKRYNFVCNKWLDVAEEDGAITRRIGVAKKEDLSDFDFMFPQLVRKKLNDGHIWFSVFTRPPQSSFTTVQRLCTCFSLLLTTMLANAMFYRGEGGKPSPSVRIGPIRLSVEDIRVAISSTLIVIFPNLIIILLFKYAGPKKDPNERYDVVEEEVEEETEEEQEHRASQSRLKLLKALCFPGEEDDDDARAKKAKDPLPHWLAYIAYVLVFITSFISALFVMLYGFQFGKKKSDQWILAMLISLLLSIFAWQPAKVMILAIFFAVFMKDSPDEGEPENSKSKKGKERKVSADEDDTMEGGRKGNYLQFKLPNERILEEFRQQRIREKQIKAIIREIFVHLLFVMLIQVVCNAAVDHNSYNLHENAKTFMTMNSITISYFQGYAYVMTGGVIEVNEDREVKPAAEITNRLQWLDWARYSITEFLFPPGWYNYEKEFIYPKGFIADNAASKVLAMARIRQLRVKPKSCVKHPVFLHLITECNADYAYQTAEETQYAEGWKPALNKTMTYRLRRGKRKSLWKGYEDPWKYQLGADISALPYEGRFAYYSGDSYSVSIGPNKRVSKKILLKLREHFWVDRYTRALITEANIYNANTNLLLITTFVHEIIPTGGWNLFYNIQALKLYRYVGGMGDIVVLFDIVFIFVTIVGLYKAVKTARRSGFKGYITNVWYLLHLVVTVCSLLAIMLFILRLLLVKDAVETYNSEPELFTSFAWVGQVEYIIMAFMGLATFFTTLEFLRILRFNKTIGSLLKTCSMLAAPMASFFVTFVIIYMSFVSYAHCIFADKLEGYRSVKMTIVYLLLMFMGQFDLSEFNVNAPFMGPLLFFSYMIIITMILINLFVGIICDAFAAAGEDDEEEEAPSVFPFMFNAISNFNSNKGIFAGNPIYTDWKDDWELMMEGFDERTDSCVYLMHTMETEEIRHSQWLESGITNKKNWCIIAAVLGLDIVDYETEFYDGIPELKRFLKRLSAAESQDFIRAAARKRQLDIINAAKEEAMDNEEELGGSIDGDLDEYNDDNSENGSLASDPESNGDASDNESQ